MAASFEVSDPSDWLETSIPQIAPVESALRCQVCKDFFDTPMITSCSHTFCSLCIRRCLTNDGKCPTCRSADQELRLRRNWTVEEVVQAFKDGRPALLQFNQDLTAANEEESLRGSKRKRENTVAEDGSVSEEGRNTRRKTRSQSRKDSGSQTIRLDSVPNSEGEDEDCQPDDGLTACPICSKRMKEAEVFSHLDVHNEPQSKNGQPSSSRSTPIEIGSRSRPPQKPMERLPQISYGLMKDTALRKKLADLGISNGGPRPLLIKRHTEWVNLVNSNCDSSRPRTKRELLIELDTWERSQGRNILNGLGGNESSTVMRKDFDGAAWASSHNNDFQQLIAKARQNAKAKPSEIRPNAESGEHGEASGETKSRHFAGIECLDMNQNDVLLSASSANSLGVKKPPVNLPEVNGGPGPPGRAGVDGIIDLGSDG